MACGWPAGLEHNSAPELNGRAAVPGRCDRRFGSMDAVFGLTAMFGCAPSISRRAGTENFPESVGTSRFSFSRSRFRMVILDTSSR
jgi:hypothetical protein